ncbi:serine protease [Vibrio sp. TH_r3]|uniref:S1 family peptidase n=1 Tax=Vibrio sp. TH_r3 TaxID=3082084 RepID=UPI00295309B4|nr:serine protease [Vibrio sp. TH_r3]MDV7102914.1 serine protease [Vibrio sp. TH_r3]
MTTLLRLLYCFALLFSGINTALAGLPETIASIKPSIVAVGTYSRLASPNSRFLGTGFAIANGQYVATNAHVVPEQLDLGKKQKLVVFVGQGRSPEIRSAEVVAINKEQDIAILQISGKALNPMQLSSKSVHEGQDISFTGYPIGSVLGLYPVTHRGIISSITPIAIPARSSKELSIKQLKRLKNNPYLVYQLDATAYPGNSGSPVYYPETGEVIAIINKVLVKSSKESLLSDPSAITYAIPISYLSEMLDSLK